MIHTVEEKVYLCRAYKNSPNNIESTQTDVDKYRQESKLKSDI